MKRLQYFEEKPFNKSMIIFAQLYQASEVINMHETVQEFKLNINKAEHITILM